MIAKGFKCGFRHLKNIGEEMRGMRILLGIAVSMVLTVHDRVSARVQKRGALEDIGHQVKHPLPKLIRRKHAVRRVAVLEKRLEEQGKKPVGNKKDQDDLHNLGIE